MVATTPASRKAKGRSFQQGVRDRICSRLGIDPADCRSTSMGAAGLDLLFSSAALRRFCGFGVEAKFQETVAIWSWLDQAAVNAKKEGVRPLLVFRRSRSKVYACLEFEDLLTLIERAGGPEP